MPATACCSLSRSLPGPWPGHYNCVQFIYLLFLFICYMTTLHCIIFMLLAIGLNKIFLIPDSLPDFVKTTITQIVQDNMQGGATVLRALAPRAVQTENPHAFSFGRQDRFKMAASDATGDDSLYPIAVLIDELRNEDVQVYGV